MLLSSTSRLLQLPQRHRPGGASLAGRVPGWEARTDRCPQPTTRRSAATLRHRRRPKSPRRLRSPTDERPSRAFHARPRPRRRGYQRARGNTTTRRTITLRRSSCPPSRALPPSACLGLDRQVSSRTPLGSAARRRPAVVAGMDSRACTRSLPRVRPGRFLEAATATVASEALDRTGPPRRRQP